MTEPAFDERRMVSAVASLETHQQLAFGAACCERILPNYRMFSEEVEWGDQEPLRRGDFDSLYTSSAQDAVFAICGLLDFLLKEDSTCVVNAARYVTDSIDLIVRFCVQSADFCGD